MSRPTWLGAVLLRLGVKPGLVAVNVLQKVTTFPARPLLDRRAGNVIT